MVHLNRACLIVIIIAGLASCNKTNSDAEDLHNHSLLKKDLPQLRAEVAGRWQVERLNYITCPFIGPCYQIDSVYRNNEGNLISFLNNDTIKVTGYTGTPVITYEQATVAKIRYNPESDSVYVFRFNNNMHQYLLQEIKNDSLVISDRGVNYYLTRKP